MSGNTNIASGTKTVRKAGPVSLKGFAVLTTITLVSGLISVSLQSACQGITIGAQRWVSLGTMSIDPTTLLVISGMVVLAYVASHVFHTSELGRAAALTMLALALLASASALVYIATFIIA